MVDKVDNLEATLDGGGENVENIVARLVLWGIACNCTLRQQAWCERQLIGHGCR